MAGDVPPPNGKQYVSCRYYSFFCFEAFLTRQMSWVIVPMGQYTHQERGLKRSMVISPNTVEVSITL